MRIKTAYGFLPISDARWLVIGHTVIDLLSRRNGVKLRVYLRELEQKGCAVPIEKHARLQAEGAYVLCQYDRRRRLYPLGWVVPRVARKKAIK